MIMIMRVSHSIWMLVFVNQQKLILSSTSFFFSLPSFLPSRNRARASLVAIQLFLEYIARKLGREVGYEGRAGGGRGMYHLQAPPSFLRTRARAPRPRLTSLLHILY